MWIVNLLLLLKEIYGLNALSVLYSYFPFFSKDLSRCPLNYCWNVKSDASFQMLVNRQKNLAALCAYDATPPAVLTSAEPLCHPSHQAWQDPHTETTVSLPAILPAAATLLSPHWSMPASSFCFPTRLSLVLGARFTVEKYSIFFPPCWAGGSGMCVWARFCEECEKTTEL